MSAISFKEDCFLKPAVTKATEPSNGKGAGGTEQDFESSPPQ